MFKHTQHVVSPINVECEVVEAHNEDLECEHENEVFDDSVNDRENDSFNKTFVNPSQDSKRENIFQCETCDFRAICKDDLKKHKIASHNWCDICFSSFVSQERLNLHMKKKHNKIVKTE